MRYNPRARLDRSQVQRRSGGGGGGFGLPVGGGGGNGIKVGGGIGGLVILLLVFLLQSQLGGGDGASSQQANGDDTSLANCRTGEDANQNGDCALVADVNSIQSFWNGALPEQTGTAYRRATTILFEGGVNTGCGNATSDVGPFYCSVDERVFLDSSFFDDMLEGQLGAQGGPFSEAYVLAHEYGHHVQNLLGTMSRAGGGNEQSVRVELQADCYAGVWAHSAGQRGLLETGDIEEALGAASAIGDDRLQRQAGGRVSPETFTHGSAEQRTRWFRRGYEAGVLGACDTFQTPML